MSDDAIDYEAGDINRVDTIDENDNDINVVGGSGAAEETLNFLLDYVVDDKEAVFVDAEEGRDGRVEYKVHVSPEDVGKVIGRKGRVIQAIRNLVKAAGQREGVNAHVEVDD